MMRTDGRKRTARTGPDASGLDIGVYGARGIPSTYSGYETFLTLLLPELVERGDRVTVYCREGEDFEPTPWKGVERKVLPAVAGKNSSTLSHGAVAGVAARLARHDVVLVVNVANAAYCALGRWTGQPVVLNVDGQEWLRGKWGGLAKRIFKGSAVISKYCANALVADGAAMADVYRDEFRSSSTVIPYCITTKDWQPDVSTLAAHGLEKGRYVLIAGRLNPENNIDAITRHYAEGSLDLPIVVLGAANYDSPVARELQALAERDPRVRVLGHVGSRPAFFDLVHHAAVYLHGHSVGGTNPSLVEAMAVGARIAAFDTPFSRETLGPDAALFRMAPSTVVSTIASILKDDRATDLAVRQATKDRANARFSVDAVVSAYRELLHATARSGFRSVELPTMWAEPDTVIQRAAA